MPADATIFALSTGLPPAGIAVVRISGRQAAQALVALAGDLPVARRATLRKLCGPDGDVLDHGLILWFPAPGSATGEDLAELHLHGGRAVVDAVLAALAGMSGLRLAEPGEFTRRALLNGRMDLTEAEGLAELLAAETADQHRQALAMSGSHIGKAVAEWQAQLLSIAAQIEALLDFADEDDVDADQATMERVRAGIVTLCADWQRWLDVPAVERLRDGIRVVIAGPPNSGKSTLINALTETDAAIVSPVAGTTRDAIDVPVQIAGLPFRFTDTAGLREASDDAIERIGIARARDLIGQADIILWLGHPAEAPDHPMVLRIAARADARASEANWPEVVAAADHCLSARTGDGMEQLRAALIRQARTLVPRTGEVAMNRRQRAEVQTALSALTDAQDTDDPLLVAEGVRMALAAFDRLTGRAGTEAMLDTLFGRFCIGK